MYKFLHQADNSITFALSTLPDNILRFTTNRAKTKENGVRVDVVRTNTLLVTPQIVKKCEDNCADAAHIERSVRIVTSGKQGDSAALVADLKAMIVVIEAHPDYFNGFPPSASETIDLQTA